MINFTMNNGLDIPAIGYGVFMMSSVEIEQHLPEAIETGLNCLFLIFLLLNVF